MRRLGGLECEVLFERSDTAALEVNPAYAVGGQNPIAVVRLAVESLPVEVQSVELSKAGVVHRAEEDPVPRREAAMKASSSSATRARSSSARNDGSFVRVLASAA